MMTRSVSFFLLGLSFTIVTRLDHGVDAWDGKRPVDSAERVRIVNVPGAGVAPDAEVDDRGVLHLVYFEGGDVYYVMSRDDGLNLTKPIRVNSEKGFAYAGAYRGPDVTVGKNSTVHVVWYNAAYQQKRPQDEWGVMYSRLRSGDSSFEPQRNLNHRPSDNFSIAADGKGKLAVFWMAGGVFASISHDDGDHFQHPIDLKTDPCECCGSRAIYSADGTLSVLYRDKADDERDTYMGLLGKDQRQFSHVKVSQAVWHIESCPMTGSFLSASPSGLIAAWETKGQIYFSRLNQRSQRTSSREIKAAERGRYPVALTASDGVSLVAWKNGTRLEWQLFDPDDTRIGPVASADAATPDRPAGIVTADGNFVLFP